VFFVICEERFIHFKLAHTWVNIDKQTILKMFFFCLQTGGDELKEKDLQIGRKFEKQRKRSKVLIKQQYVVYFDNMALYFKMLN